jgi:hypothetical protein
MGKVLLIPPALMVMRPEPGRVLVPIIQRQSQNPSPSAVTVPKPLAVLLLPLGVVYASKQVAPGWVRRLADAVSPRLADSDRKTIINPLARGVSVGVEVFDWVGVGVFMEIKVGVGVGVEVAVLVGSGEKVGKGVIERVFVGIGDKNDMVSLCVGVAAGWVGIAWVRWARFPNPPITPHSTPAAVRPARMDTSTLIAENQGVVLAVVTVFIGALNGVVFVVRPGLSRSHFSNIRSI